MRKRMQRPARGAEVTGGGARPRRQAFLAGQPPAGRVARAAETIERPEDPARLPPAVSEVLQRPGEPVPPALRGPLGERIGHDFGAVRLHVDAPAARSARR